MDGGSPCTGVPEFKLFKSNKQPKKKSTHYYVSFGRNASCRNNSTKGQNNRRSTAKSQPIQCAHSFQICAFKQKKSKHTSNMRTERRHPILCATANGPAHPITGAGIYVFPNLQKLNPSRVFPASSSHRLTILRQAALYTSLVLGEKTHARTPQHSPPLHALIYAARAAL